MIVGFTMKLHGIYIYTVVQFYLGRANLIKKFL